MADIAQEVRELLDGAGAAPGLGWLEAALRWLREEEGPARTARLRALEEGLRRHPGGTDLRLRLAAAWSHASAVRLLAETGLPDRPTLLGEGFQRLLDRAVPRWDAEEDLYALLNRLDLEEADAEWILSLGAGDLEPWTEFLRPNRDAWIQAARLLAHRAAGVGLSRDLLDLSPEVSDADSPFFVLPKCVREWGWHPGDAERQRAWDACRASCREELARAHALLDERGVSTDLAYRLDLLEGMLRRIDDLLHAAAGQGDGPAFAAELVRSAAGQRSLRDLARGILKRLARKVVEHTGETGEHYIASDRKEWRAIGWAAAGGGVLTAFTALVKYGLAAAPLAPLFAGLGLAINYSASFVALQLLGFTLASKQPAMTAASLAAALERENGIEEEVELIAAISRTQVIASLGNVFATIPVALGICALWRVWGAGPLGTETAVHGLAALHPFRSWTMLYAAITGVFLWMSSLAAGWAGNWSAYRRLPEAMARSPRLIHLLGPTGAARAGAFVRRHLSGIVGYTALGVLLGFVPVFVHRFVGIPLEVRHVTLQAASLALDAGSLWGTADFHWGPVLWALASIAVIGALNFGVSFALALRTALRARDLSAKGRRDLRRALLSALNRQPGRFLWAPKADRLEAPLLERDHA
jgi:site-specific recombinase